MRTIGTAVWVVGTDRTIRWMNGRASRLLGVSALHCPCHRIVVSFDVTGRPWCGPTCPLFAAAAAGREIPPRMLRLSRCGADRWIQLLLVPVPAPDGSGPCLVHCALDADEAHRIRGYVARLATRTSRPGPGQRGAHRHLTQREHEILARLERDQTLWAIACDLQIAHGTVRNHVQSILGKLGVHSIAEAVARSLIERPDSGRLPAPSTAEGALGGE